MSSGYRHKTDEPYAEFLVRERSPFPGLTIEVESTYHEDFVALLKAHFRHGSERAWDPDLKRWFISPTVLQKACEIAGNCFQHVYLVEGERTTDVISGQSWEQKGLF